MTGQSKPTPYRDGQNVIRNSRTGKSSYMPPEAKAVPALMSDLVKWINQQLYEGDLPVPLIAALAHYQFATIHPYYDGNGRTARLLANLILHKAGYGLKGIYSLDEYYARNLTGYYAGLTVGPSHNYHLGREEADMTGFLDFFCVGMAEAFSAVRAQAAKAAKQGAQDQSGLLRKLDPRERRLLGTVPSEWNRQRGGNRRPPQAQSPHGRWVMSRLVEIRIFGATGSFAQKSRLSLGQGLCNVDWMTWSARHY